MSGELRNKVFSTAKAWAVLAIIAGAALCVQPPAARSSETAGRIAYVDLTRVLNSTSDGIKAKDQLKLEFKEKQQRLDAMKKEKCRRFPELRFGL